MYITLIFAGDTNLQVMKMNRKDILFYALLIAVTTIIKIVCSPNLALSGTTGIMAVALFAGMNNNYKKANSFILPLLTLLITNTILQVLYAFNIFPFSGFYKWQFVEYSLVILLTSLGLLFRKTKTAGVFISAVAGPTVFFFISNFIVWAASSGLTGTTGYTHDFAGLVDCYTRALPFYRNSLISTVVLLPVLIMAYHWIVKGKAGLALAD